MSRLVGIVAILIFGVPFQVCGQKNTLQLECLAGNAHVLLEETRMQYLISRYHYTQAFPQITACGRISLKHKHLAIYLNYENYHLNYKEVKDLYVDPGEINVVQFRRVYSGFGMGCKVYFLEKGKWSANYSAGVSRFRSDWIRENYFITDGTQWRETLVQVKDIKPMITFRQALSFVYYLNQSLGFKWEVPFHAVLRHQSPNLDLARTPMPYFTGIASLNLGILYQFKY